jgi:hypothetical protein
MKPYPNQAPTTDSSNAIFPATDYPAAHSMDTTWFAVDKDGHVAAFESAEGGAVPNDALTDQQGDFDALQEIRPYASSCDVIYALEDQKSPLSKDRQHALPQKPYPRTARSGFLQRIIAKLTGKNGGITDTAAASTESEPEEEMIAPVIMFLNDLQIVASAIAEGVCQPVKCVRGRAVLSMKLPIDLYRQIHERNQCAGCYYEFSLEPFDGIELPEYSKLGLFYYACCEDQMAVPYGRHTVPEQPLNIKQLPAELQEQFTKLQFADLSFSQTPYIQPAQRTASFSWDGGYLREDWETYQANPGQEKEYEEIYKFYRELQDDEHLARFKLEPPGSSNM